MKTAPILHSIKSHLEARIKGVAILLYPEKPESYRLNHPNGAILIPYFGSNYGEIQDVTFTNQKRTLRIPFTVVARSQWSDMGAIDLLDQLRDSVAGFMPLNCQKGRLIREAFVAENQGIWTYELTVDFLTQNIEHVHAQKIIN